MWYAKTYGGYARDSTEGQSNANEIASVLSANGWDIKSIAALLGNGAGESGLNPWRWESDYIPTVSEFNSWSDAQARQHGYGIFQFTPANKYINQTNAQNLGMYGYSPNFSDYGGTAQDGMAQSIYFISAVAGDWLHGLYNYYYDDFIGIGVDISGWYYTSFNNFKNGVDNNGNPLTVAQLTGVFELCYERPGDIYAASSYYTRVNNAEYWYTHLSPTPVPVHYKSMKWIYYMKRRRF